MSDEMEMIKEPTTSDELLASHKISRTDPQRYLRIVDEWIRKTPDSPHAYFDRHFAWMKIGEPRRALRDLDKAIELASEPDPMSFMFRGRVYRHLGEYEKALADFDRAEAINARKWDEDIVFGLLYQADTHARLGNESTALTCCARLPGDFWTPGIDGTPGGGKAEIAEKLRSTAADARRKRS
jgi:tetratricopeptide (TPR) repeat protein